MFDTGKLRECQAGLLREAARLGELISEIEAEALALRAAFDGGYSCLTPIVAVLRECRTALRDDSVLNGDLISAIDKALDQDAPIRQAWIAAADKEIARRKGRGVAA